MSTSVSDENLERKFQAATNTQDSIQTLSLWLLHHKAHHQKIVTSWMKVLKKAKINHRLTLFYLANDVVQNGKRKGFLQFGNSFAEVLREATLLVRDEQIRPAIQRVFTIWEQRNIYSPEFIADLRAILANTKVPATAHSKLLAEFKPDIVIEKLRLVMKLELDVASKMSTINLSKLNATNAEIVQQLKDRIHGQQFKREFDESTQRLEDLIKTLNKELKERTELILLLEQSEIYYDTQRGEAKIVANAYKNFGGRVKTLQKKLEELASTFPSPVPSPCPDAPSPTTSDQELELSLPNDQAGRTAELENIESVPSPVGTPDGLNLSPPTSETEVQPVTAQSVGNPIPTLSNFFSHGQPAVLESATSPTRTPEENISFTPPHPPPKISEPEVQPVSIQSVGNPIPTLSSFFSHEQSGMSSWLGTFSNKKKILTSTSENNEVTKSDSSSLDSRLSNLLQNIPNLPSGLQSTLFGNNSSGNNTPLQDSVNSPLRGKKESTHTGESTTPIKDEYSGQNTPLQDEESTHSSHTFFPKVSNNSKPKDMLKNLTSLIQSVSGDKSDDSQKKEKYGYGAPDSFDQGGMSSFIKKIIPSISSSSPSSSYFNSTQPTLPTVAQTRPVAQTSTVNSYETVQFHNVPVYSSKPATIDGTEHLSFIPALVPLTSQDDFNYGEDEYPTNEYNPELETFDTSMDVEDPIDDVLDEHSPVDSLSPIPSASIDEIPRPSGGRRLSTLITVITKDSPENSLPTPEYISDDVNKSDKENITQEHEWIDEVSPKTDDTWDKPVAALEEPEPLRTLSPTEEFFIGKEAAALPPPFYTAVPPPPIIDHGPPPIIDHGPPPIIDHGPPPMIDHGPPLVDRRPPLVDHGPPIVDHGPPIVDHGPPNGQNVPYLDTPNTPTDHPLSKIETLHSAGREGVNGRWLENNWEHNNNRRPIPPPFPPGPPPMPCGMQDTRFYDKRNFHPHFPPRNNNWFPRNRHENSFRPYGPPPPKRFPFRGGRGRGRFYPYY